MKASCSTKILESLGSKNIFDAINLAAELGLAGINIDTENSALISIDNFSFLKSSEIARHAITREIEIQSLTVAPAKAAGEEINRLNKLVSVAHSLSCPLIVFRTEPVDEKFGIIKQYNQVTKNLKTAAKLAADFDVCLAVEPARGSIADTFEKVLQLFVDVNEYNFGVVLNSPAISAVEEKDIIRDIELIGESLLLVKFSDAKLNVNILNHLKKQNFDNYICLSNGVNSKEEIISFINSAIVK